MRRRQCGSSHPIAPTLCHFFDTSTKPDDKFRAFQPECPNEASAIANTRSPPVSATNPKSGARGVQWRDHRRVINGILWKLRTGTPWRDLPERYRPSQTCAERLYRWRRDGTWDRMLAHVQTKLDAVGAVVWEVSNDSSTALPPSLSCGRISLGYASERKETL